MPAARVPLTAERLRIVLAYDGETGHFRWRGATVGRGYSYKRTADGKVAGAPDMHGYRLISVDGTLYRANRLAWLYVTGAWPPSKVDHKDTDPSNDRWSNLRLATDSQNAANAKVSKNNKCGIKGIFQTKSGKWVAQACKDRVRYRLGTFETAAAAKAAYDEASHRLHGEFARAA